MNFEIDAARLGLILCVAVFTAIAAVVDFRTRRIPNNLNLPFFIAGLIYRTATEGWTGLADAAIGFGIGFGCLFVLWMVGGGGGGDAKFMGALSVWLGQTNTLLVLAISTLFVLTGTFVIMMFGVFTQGARRTREKFVQSSRRLDSKTAETAQQKAQRRIMTYATPVALATWVVLGWSIAKPLLVKPVETNSAGTAAVEVPAASNDAG